MKQTFLLLLAFFITSAASAQLATYDAALEAQATAQTAIQTSTEAAIATLNGATEAENAQQSAYRYADYASEFLQGIAALKEIITLLSGMACAQQNLSQSYHTSFNSCFFSFRYNVALMKVQMSADFVKIALSGYKMTSGERIKTLNDVVSRLHEANKEMQTLITQIQIQNLLDRAMSKARARATTPVDRSRRTSFSF